MTTAPKRRRGKGEGSIYLDDATGRWVGQLDLGRNAAGDRQRRKVTGRTKTEVSVKMRELRKVRDGGHDIAKRAPTVEAVTRQWLELGAPGPKGAKQETTMYRLERRLDDHLLPGVGSYRVDVLRPEHVEAWLATEAAKGHARSTLLDYRGDLRQILNFAKRRRLVSWNVAAEAVVPDGRTTSPKVILTRAEREQLYAAVADDRLGAYFVLLGELGLRPGEADGLRWSCVDLEARTLYVEAGMKRNDGIAFAVGDPKTPKSVRGVRLTARCVTALKRHRKLQAAEQLRAGPYWSTDDRWADLVFRSELGTPLHSSNVRRSLRKACERAGVPTISPAALRPTAATILAEDVPLMDVADQLGHVDTRMVERVYRHRPAIVETAASVERARARK